MLAELGLACKEITMHQIRPGQSSSHLKGGEVGPFQTCFVKRVSTIRVRPSYKMCILFLLLHFELLVRCKMYPKSTPVSFAGKVLRTGSWLAALSLPSPSAPINSAHRIGLGSQLQGGGVGHGRVQALSRFGQFPGHGTFFWLLAFCNHHQGSVGSWRFPMSYETTRPWAYQPWKPL